MSADLSQYSKSINQSIEECIQLYNERPVIYGYTIDGETSKDLDDGISLTKSGDKYSLKVSIADVSEIVQPESKLFYSCLETAETKYLAHGNIPMLPRYLSEDKLSLLHNCARPVITFGMDILPNGDVENFTISENIFVNKRRLSYSEFDRIESKIKDDPDHETFKEMGNLANSLLEIRRSNGALAIYDIIKGIYTNEEGEIKPLKDEFSHLSNIVIQEFMILTNTTFAWFFAENHIPMLFRNHTANMNAPSRNVIMEQINVAILNPNYLEALRGRTRLWFNRADYSPYLKGHFGLNLPVYSHITSPIRRVVDLINHMSIKSYLHKTEPPFDFNKLEFMSDCINKVIAQNKYDKSKFFKEKTQYFSVKKLQTSSESDLVKMEQNEFEAILRASAISDEVPENLSAAIKSRFKFHNIDIYILYIILFKTLRDSSNWLEIKKNSLNYINSRKEIGPQLLNILKQKNLLSDFKIDSIKSKDTFLSKTSAIFNDQEYKTTCYSTGSKKKEAIYNSVYKLLHLLLGIDESEITINSNVFPNELLHENAPSAIGLVGSDETSSLSNEENDDNISDLLNAKDSINHTKNDEVLSAFNENDLKKLFQGENSDYIISGKEIEANYVGQLLELCAQKKGWNLPEYEFRIKGKANEPVIFCKCKLVAPTEIFEETAVSTNKKSAKHEAARKIIDKIYKLPVVESNVEYDLNDIDGKSNISKLMELCTKMKIDLPSFDYNQRGTLHQPSFECTLSIRWNKEFYKFNGSGATKKEAKQMAAGNCIEKLKLDSLD